jgi:hypothetical protein
MTSAEIAEPAPNAALYIDASSLLVLILGQTGHADVQAHVVSWEKAGGNVVSSRLLWLEVRRVVIRERLAGNDFPPVAEDSLSRIKQVPSPMRSGSGPQGSPTTFAPWTRFT